MGPEKKRLDFKCSKLVSVQQVEEVEEEEGEGEDHPRGEASHGSAGRIFHHFGRGG